MSSPGKRLDRPGSAGKRAREIGWARRSPMTYAEILVAYRRLSNEYGEDVSFAFDSSATAEDLRPPGSPVQQETLPQFSMAREFA